MKICHLAYNTFLPDARIYKEAESLAAAGHEVTVLAIAKEGLEPEEMMGAVRVRRLSLTTPCSVKPAAGKSSRVRNAARRIVRGVSLIAALPVLCVLAVFQGLRYLAAALPLGRLHDKLSALERFIHRSLRRFYRALPPSLKEKLPAGLLIRSVRRIRRRLRRIRRIPQAARKRVKPVSTMRRIRSSIARPYPTQILKRRLPRLRRVARIVRSRVLTFTFYSRVGKPLVHWFRQRAYGLAVLREVERIRPDVVHAHDISTLRGGIAAARKVGAGLIYDAHEMEWECSRIQTNWCLRFAWRLWEAMLVSAADALVTVSPRIGELYRRRYRLAAPTIIPNVPRRSWESAPLEFHLREQIPNGHRKRIVLNLGNVTSERGIPQALAALQYLPEDVVLATLGNIGEKARAELDRVANDLGVASRFFPLPPVHFTQVANVAADADVGLVLVQPIGLSYRYCMPNKLFEMLHAGTPLVVGRLPDVEAIVRQNEAGEVCDQLSPESIAQAIQQASGRAEHLTPERVNAIRDGYCWEAFEPRLLNLYSTLRIRTARRSHRRRWLAWANLRNWRLAFRSGPHPTKANAFAGLNRVDRIEVAATKRRPDTDASETLRFDAAGPAGDARRQPERKPALKIPQSA